MNNTDRSVYIKHIRRLVAERDELKAAIQAERKIRQRLVKQYYKRLESRFWWLIDYWALINRRQGRLK